jgi:hypothetical protein
MCVEKTRAYVKDNKLKLLNGIVGWGRPVYAGEENAELLNKLAAVSAPEKTVVKKSAKPALKKPTGNAKPKKAK